MILDFLERNTKSGNTYSICNDYILHNRCSEIKELEEKHLSSRNGAFLTKNIEQRST